MDATFAITSIGCAASQLQIGVAAITDGFVELGIEPNTRINGIPYYHASDIERLRDHIAVEHSRP